MLLLHAANVISSGIIAVSAISRNAFLQIFKVCCTMGKRVQNVKYSFLHKDILVQIVDLYFFILAITLALYDSSNVVKFLSYFTAVILSMLCVITLYRVIVYIVNKLFTPWQQFCICQGVEKAYIIVTFGMYLLMLLSCLYQLVCYGVSVMVVVAYADDGSGKAAPTLYSRFWTWLNSWWSPTAVEPVGCENQNSTQLPLEEIPKKVYSGLTSMTPNYSNSSTFGRTPSPLALPPAFGAVPPELSLPQGFGANTGQIKGSVDVAAPSLYSNMWTWLSSWWYPTATPVVEPVLSAPDSDKLLPQGLRQSVASNDSSAGGALTLYRTVCNWVTSWWYPTEAPSVMTDMTVSLKNQHNDAVNQGVEKNLSPTTSKSSNSEDFSALLFRSDKTMIYMGDKRLSCFNPEQLPIKDYHFNTIFTAAQERARVNMDNTFVLPKYLIMDSTGTYVLVPVVKDFNSGQLQALEINKLLTDKDFSIRVNNANIFTPGYANYYWLCVSLGVFHHTFVDPSTGLARDPSFLTLEQTKFLNLLYSTAKDTSTISHTMNVVKCAQSAQKCAENVIDYVHYGYDPKIPGIYDICSNFREGRHSYENIESCHKCQLFESYSHIIKKKWADPVQLTYKAHYTNDWIINVPVADVGQSLEKVKIYHPETYDYIINKYKPQL